MNKRVNLISILLLLVFGSYNIFSQQTPPTDKVPPTEINKDDVLILVNIKADSLKFDVVPNTNVEFPGTHERKNVWITERQNLPDKVEPGVTYRDIGLQLRISTRFADIERIVREILGETPPSGTMAASTAQPSTVSQPTPSPVGQPAEKKSIAKTAPVKRTLTSRVQRKR